MRTEDYSESLVVHFRRAEVLRAEALDLVSIDLNERQLFDLELLLNRGFYPLTGFMDRQSYQEVIDNMRLPDGSVWPMPICLDVDELNLQLEQVPLGEKNGGDAPLAAHVAAEHRLEDVRQHRLLVAPPGGLLAAPQQQGLRRRDVGVPLHAY